MDNIKLRPGKKEEAQAIKDIFRSTNFFYEFELEVVNDLIDGALEEEGDASFYMEVAEVDNEPVGAIIYGQDPMSTVSWNLYWIAVREDFRGKKIGQALVKSMEDSIGPGAQIYIETSARELYKPTREFYLRVGYTLEAELKDYFAINDSKCIFSKRLTGD